MRIRYLNGRQFQLAVVAGSHWVTQRQEYLNRINVFPVPDSDTGTNMAATLQSVAEGAVNCSERSIDAVSRAIADSALMGARGNSGAILAQFFQGLAEGLRGRLRITTKNFSAAVLQACERAREAIAEPQEGTILTVIRDWATRIEQNCHRVHDFAELLHDALQEAKRSLAETPKKLKVLAKAGVVDAGAAGFVHMLEGILHFIESGRVEHGEAVVPKDILAAKIEKAPEQIRFQYCTECLLEGDAIDHRALRNEISSFGDSLIVAGSAQKVRVHIHTDEPENVWALAERFGTVRQRKAEDMRRQHVQSFKEGHLDVIAIVTDSSCDLPEEYIREQNIHVVPLRIQFGEEGFIDKVTLRPSEFYDKLVTSAHHPKTSQPTPGDFKKVYDEVAGRYRSVISIHLSSRLSGTLQAAAAAAKTVQGAPITVIDGKNASIALGLIVAEAMSAIKEGLSHEEVVARVHRAIAQVRLFVSVPTMKYLIRGGRVSRTKGLLAKVLGLKPILTLRDGVAVPAAKTLGGKHARKTILKLVTEQARGLKNLRFAVAHANALAEADWFAGQIKRRFEVRDVMVVEAAPVLCAHTGPGAVGVAFLGD